MSKFATTLSSNSLVFMEVTSVFVFPSFLLKHDNSCSKIKWNILSFYFPIRYFLMITDPGLVIVIGVNL